MRLLLALSMALGFVSPNASSGELIAFIGSKLTMERAPDEVCLPRGTCVHMDGYYRARYRVEQMVYGDSKASELDFGAYDHFRPMFSHFDHVMLFLKPTEKGLVHYKNQYVLMGQAATGEFIHCTMAPELAGSLINVQLQGVGEADFEWEADATQKGRFQTQDGSVYRIGSTIFCRQAETSAEVVARYAKDYFKPKGIDLHL
ncbi:MAG: hypothetical protein ACJ8GW_04165 [Massilia sp.]